MKEKWDTINLLRHVRHDWLNHLQLIKGNLSLNRTDRAKEIIEEVVREAKNESKISNLKMPRMAELLLTYNWQQNVYRMDYEVIGEARGLSTYDEALYLWMRRFLNQLESTVKIEGEPHLMITLELLNNKIRISFDFAGTLNTKGSFEKWAKSLTSQHNSMVIIESYCQENELLYILELQG